MVFALDAYYTNMIEYVLKNFAKKFSKVKSEFEAPLPIIIAGGTSMPKGFKVNEKEVRLVFKGNKADLAVDGYYIDSKKEYIPLMEMPNWVWIFIIGCMAIPFYTFGGAVPAVIGIVGAILCAKVSVQLSMGTPLKAFLSLLITGLSWFILFMFIEFLLSVGY